MPLAWEIGNNESISAFVHPNGIFDDPNGGRLRRILYPKLRKHFQFTNELKLFDEVHHNTNFSLNVYSNSPGDYFEVISNLLNPSTIEECYSDKLGDAVVPGLKDENGNWELRGHKNRIIGVTKEELLIFARVFDGNDLWMEARLPIIHLNEYISVLKCFANYNKQVKTLGEDIVCSEMWHEANDQKKKIIKREVHIPDSLKSTIYSGPHIGLANPFNKSSRIRCELNSDYDTVDLSIIPEDYLPRVNYAIENEKDFSMAIIDTNWGNKFNQNYMICSRKMLNLTSERSLYTSILPPGTSYINGIFGMVVKSDVSIIAGAMASLPYDFYMRVTGKSNAHFDTFSSFPLMNDSQFADDIRIRALLLNCLSSNYSGLWEAEYRESYKECDWGKESDLLPKNIFRDVSKQWNHNSPIRNDFQRRQALVELDVLVAMELGMTLEQLKTIYKVQFPVMQMYEQDTWYDQKGNIVYTNSRSINGIGCSKEEWNSHVSTETMPVEIENKAGYLGVEEVVVKKVYIPPFFKCNRLSDYEEVWHHFEKSKALS